MENQEYEDTEIKNETSDSRQREEEEEEEEEETSSEEEEEENGKLVDAKIQQMILETEVNPFQYDKHIELIAGLRASADLDQLRTARENMAKIFPLSEELWIEWFEDELPLAVVPEQKKYIISKFESAVKDYASVKVWHEYCQYMMNNIDSPTDIECARNVFEQAIIAVGLHVTEGTSIWDGYREFEMAILESYQLLQDSNETVGMEFKVEEQIERIASLYKRQLSLPLIGIATVMESFENWYSQPVPDDTERNFDKSQKKITLLMNYEEKLCKAEGSNLMEYFAYIDYEINSGDPARIQSIFERAIKDHCLDYDLWEKYTNYMDFKLKIPNLAVDVHKRAVRNCPWLSRFWQNYLKALERNSVDSQIYLDVFNQSLKGGLFADVESHLQLWLIRCGYYRRCISDWNLQEDKIAVLRKSYDSGIAYMNHYFSLDGDKYCVLLRDWAFIEAHYCKNVKKSVELWDTVMKKHSHDANMWLEYINFLILFTEIVTVRRVFQRAVQINMEQPEVVCDAFMKFERHYGFIHDVDSAQQKINFQMKQHKQRCMKQFSMSENSDNQIRKRKNKFDVTGELGNKKKRRNEKKKDDVKQDQEYIDEAKSSSLSHFSSFSHRDKFDATGELGNKNEKKRKTVKFDIGIENNSNSNTSLSNSVMNGTGKEASVQSVILDEAPTETAKEEVSPMCSSQPPPDDIVMKNELSNSCPDDDVTNSDHEDSCRDVDNVDKDTSVFLSNLLFTVEESHLNEMFTPCGEINKVHVVRNKLGKSKGYAYLEFKEKESVEAALKLDRERLLGRPVFVSPCVDTKENPTQFKFPITLDKQTLYVSNLPFELGTEEVENHFATAGEIKQVRLVTNRSGKSRGYAYVEYQSETIASAAILKFDKQMLNGRPINVSLSNPPTRKPNLTQKRVLGQATEYVKPKKSDFPAGSRGKSKTQISLLPRALLKTKPEANQPSNRTDTASASVAMEANSCPVETAQTTPMNNSDFRKFLLK